MATTRIEWADRVWNPVTGCTKVSEGCRNCYAERIAGRFWGERKFTQVQCHADRLDDPLHWKKSSRVFVNSMSDLFHPEVSDRFIGWFFSRMGMAKNHIFMVLTKRPERMSAFLQGLPILKNVWLGVSVEDQKTADERIPLLLQTPAVVRFVSYEPALGPVDLIGFLPLAMSDISGMVYSPVGTPFLDWVICGGETGPEARPMHPDWARSVRDQCQAAGVPFFFKGWGEWGDDSWHGTMPGSRQQIFQHGMAFTKWGKKRSGRLLDGREWNEFPEVE